MIKHWQHKSRKLDIIFSCIILCFLTSLSIDFYIKQTGDRDGLKIVLSSLFISFGFGIMLYDNYFNARWKFGFYVVCFMFLFSTAITISHLVRMLTE
jgi:Kef-type K+ transport system membrane component KefB